MIAPIQRRLKSPRGFAQPFWASISRIRKRSTVASAVSRYHHHGTPRDTGPDDGTVARVIADDPPRVDWQRIFVVFWLTSMVEGIGVSQVFALLPAALSTMGVPPSDRLTFVGLFNALVFVVGAPLVPLWGVWADKYSRKAVIARSAVVEAIVFTGAALSHEPWQLAISLLLIGFQLGNTGVMLAGLRDVAPRPRLGTIIALFGVAGPVGFAVGPALAGILIDRAQWSIQGVWALSALLSLGTAALVAFGTREIRPPVVPEGRVLPLAYGALRAALGDPTVRRLFAVYGVVFLANQMSRPYMPIVVEGIVGFGPGLATAIAVVVGGAALVGALGSPLAGALGDRIGFSPVLVGSLAAAGVALLVIPLVGNIPPLAALAALLAGSFATVGSMVFALLARVFPVERRPQTLNLFSLPLYVAGIVGPAVGSVVATAGGIAAPFWVGGIVALGAAVVLATRATRLLGTPLPVAPAPGGATSGSAESQRASGADADLPATGRSVKLAAPPRS